MTKLAHRRGYDLSISVCVVLLLLMGVVLSLATSPDAAARFDVSDPHYFTKRQSIFALFALGVFLAFSFVDAVSLRRLALFGALVGFFALLLVMVLGKEVNGSQRWLSVFGFALQPSEFIKPCIVVSIAWFFARAQHHQSTHWLVFSAGLSLVLIGLILAQPDVGQAFLLALGISVVVYSFGIRLRYLAAFGVVSLVFLSLLYFTMGHVRQRLDAFLGMGDSEPFQLRMAQNAINEGGLFGVGAGHGVWKSKLPDAHTDFVFSVLAEEYGLIGVMVLLALYAFIIVRLFWAAAFLLDSFRRAAVMALTTLFALQAFINIGVNLAILPAKGMTLPFVSYGGSSILGCAITLGLACGLARHSR